MYTLGRVLAGSLLTFYFCLPSLGATDENAQHSFECEAEESYLEFLNGLEPTSFPEESLTCFQSLEEADPENVLIIDIRASKEFRQVRIPRSINLTTSELLSTEALESRSILIVDKGFARTDPARLCAKAQAKGFTHFRILFGGMAAWHAAGKQIQGLPEHLPSLYRIGPREFLRELKQNRVSVLSTDAYSDYLGKMAPSGLIVTRLDPELALDRQLLSHFERVGDDQTAPVVLLGANEIAENFSPTLRSVFALDSSPHQLAMAYQSHLAVADKRQAVPERFRCGG